MSFDLKNYETVKQRKKRFYETYSDGRIVPRLISPIEELENYAAFRVEIFLNAADQEKSLPRSSGYALEIRDKELSRSSSGKSFESVNYTSWTENCEESAVGRALDNGNFFSEPKCSREEMEKANRHFQSFSAAKPAVSGTLPLGPLGKFVVPVGKNKGKTLDQLSKADIDNFIKWGKEQPDLKGAALTTLKEMEKFQNG